MNNGHDVELLFEQRLRQMGYEGVCRPAREDCGVDFVIHTSKGWIGIQVKSAKRNNRHGSGNLRVNLDGTPKKPLKREVFYAQKRRDLTHYIRAGVSVFALHSQGVFYLVPIDQAKTNGVYVSGTSVFREAWIAVLGSPVDRVSERTEEIAQFESLYASEP